VEKMGGVVDGAGEWGDIVVERAPRDRRSFDILSVKKEELVENKKRDSFMDHTVCHD